MLEIKIHGENISLTDALKDYVNKRINKIERYLDDSVQAVAHVNLVVYPNKTGKSEVTIPLPYLTLRAEETSDDLYKSVDHVSDKLERQIRKYKTKVNRKSREKGYKGLEFLVNEDEAKNDANVDLDIVKTKQIQLKPMDDEEAVLQMDLLGHNFYVYENDKTGITSIVYRRNDGHYGLLKVNN